MSVSTSSQLKRNWHPSNEITKFKYSAALCNIVVGLLTLFGKILNSHVNMDRSLNRVPQTEIDLSSALATNYRRYNRPVRGLVFFSSCPTPQIRDQKSKERTKQYVCSNLNGKLQHG